MTIKKNTDYTATLLVMDKNSRRVDNDSPIVTIQNAVTYDYWDGVSWRNDPFQHAMQLLANGLYTFTFTPEETGTYNIVCESQMYGLKSIDVLYVCDEQDDSVVFSWPIGDEHTVIVSAIDNQESAKVKIYRQIDKSYYFIEKKKKPCSCKVEEIPSWQPYLAWNTMARVDGQFVFTFVPDQESVYNIEVATTSGQKMMYTLSASQTAESAAPILVSSKTFKNNDGTDSIITDAIGRPLMGVRISFFDMKNNKTKVASTQSDSNGEWRTAVKPGKYYVMFEKEGYVAKGFERTVT